MPNTSISNDSSVVLLDAYQAAHTNVVVFDLSERTQIEIKGADRVRFLHSFTSNDIKRLKPGQGCETFVTNLKGKVVAHVFVFCGEDSLWLDGTPGQQEAITSHLGKFLLIDDVQLIPHTGDRGELFVTGPLAAQLLQLEGSLAICGHVGRDSDGLPFEIRRVDLLGQPGFLLSIPHSRLEIVKRSFLVLGIACGTNVLFELLRIEAGFPKFGVDITDDNLAQEVARTKQCVSFDKGCYLGQETIARLDALGHTNRELRRLRFQTSIVPTVGSPIFDLTGTTEIGTITSATRSIEGQFADQSAVVFAMGMIKRIACKAETSVQLKFEGHEIAGSVL